MQKHDSIRLDPGRAYVAPTRRRARFRRVVRAALRASAAALALLVLSAPSLADETETTQDPESASWYASAVVAGRGGYRMTHHWSSGPSLRAETVVGVNPLTTIVRGNRYWVFNELAGVGIEIERAPMAVANDVGRGRPFGNDLDTLIRLGGERVESGALSGIPAETWRATNAAGRRTVWVSIGEPKVPLRVENFDRESGESATLSYSNWASGFEIPGGFFEPPASLTLRRFDYERYVGESLKGTLTDWPILFPTMLHGPRPE